MTNKQKNIFGAKTKERVNSAVDAEISRKLAVAIGWNDDVENPDVVIESSRYDEQHCAKVWVEAECAWKVFDFRDGHTWGPIGRQFGVKFLNPDEFVWVARCKGHRVVADSLERAGALAVIAAAGREAGPQTVVYPEDDFPPASKSRRR